jgi:V/A-type H+-transporting ATPase subunit E
MEMHNRIQEITEKIHQEGLEKANRETEKILEEARSSARKIVEDAQKEAEKIRADAKRSAEEFSDRIKSEVRLSQQQALAHLKSEIAELILTSVVKEPLKESLEDQGFMNELVEAMVKNWNDSHGDADLQVMVPADQLKEIESHIQAHAKELMNKGLVVKTYPGIKKGFEVQPGKGNYKISLSDEAFELFIKEHFKPKTIEFLFGSKKA